MEDSTVRGSVGGSGDRGGDEGWRRGWCWLREAAPWRVANWAVIVLLDRQGVGGGQNEVGDVGWARDGCGLGLEGIRAIVGEGQGEGEKAAGRLQGLEGGR